MEAESRFQGADREWGLGYFFTQREEEKDRAALCMRSWAEGSVFLGSRRRTPVEWVDEGGVMN